MAQSNDTMGMLDLMIRPGFCVKDNLIVKVNPAAESQQIAVGTPVSKLLKTGKKEYESFTGGCLYLTLDLYGQSCGASVTRLEDYDVFLLEQDSDQIELQAMALAARELRDPLTSIMATVDCLSPIAARQEDPSAREQVARLTRGLYQMLRVVGNMSDAERYASGTTARMETADITSLMAEIFAKARTLVEHTGISLVFTNLNKPVLSLADPGMLERAILNLLSNALKFTPKGGSIRASLTKRSGMLILTIQDDGEGVTDSLKGSFFNRYQRKPAIEDTRQGIGLGMLLVRSAAAQHGGTVLLDQPDCKGTRITMTMAIRHSDGTTVSSPRLRIDYAGELDHSLLELADSLPPALYQNKNSD